MSHNDVIWTEAECLVVTSHRDGLASLEMIFSAQGADRLTSEVQAIVSGGEKKWRLPVCESSGTVPVQEHWTLFLNATSGAERCVVAHPSSSEWVGSLSCSVGRWKLLSDFIIEQLAPNVKSGSSKSIDLSQWGTFSYPSNLKIIVHIK